MIGFGKKKKEQNTCMIMDSLSKVLAKGRLEKPQGDGFLRVKVTEGSIRDVLRTNKVQIVPSQEDQPATLGRVVDCDDNDVISFTPLRELKGEEARTNLRMPVDFTSYAYPLGTADKARSAIRANDLSGGGVAFYCAREFAPGDQLEVVIPITRTAPLLLKCQILRKGGANGEYTLYAAKFLDIIDEEESLVREAVFRAQLQHIRDRQAS